MEMRAYVLKMLEGSLMVLLSHHTCLGLASLPCISLCVRRILIFKSLVLSCWSQPINGNALG